MIRNIRKTLLLSVFLIISISVCAQEGTYGAYSPYSIFGIGDLSQEGSAFNKSMGGVGIATRNKRFINYMNPAAVTARDSLSFMADFGLSQNNKIFRQGDIRSAHNTFNIYDFVLSFPIWKSSAFMVGITPFSDVGYDFTSYETNKDITGQVGNITYDSYGKGSIYQVFAGAGATFWKRLSVGAEIIYYFGTIDKTTDVKFSDDSYRSVNSGSELMLRGLTGKFGLQWEQKIAGNISMTAGATYRLGTNVSGYADNFRYATQSGVNDKLPVSENINLSKDADVRFGDELGVGISVKGGDMWSAEFDYIRSDWRNSGMDRVNGFSVVGDAVFSTSVANSFRAGFEIVPNRNDIRYYFKRCAYRAGVYHNQEYYRFNGRNVSSTGITLGITLPVFRWYNGITLGVDLGQRGSSRNGMIRERYAMFMIGFNIHDIWFQKPRYN